MKITKENYDVEVLKSDKPVIMTFSAPWWGACQMIDPVLAGIEKERNDIKVGIVNVDDDPKLAKDFRVVSIPHTVVIKDGEQINEGIGYMTKEQLIDLLN